MGKIASGKGTVATILGKEFDVMSFPFSDRLRAISLAMGFVPPYKRGELRQINDLYKPTFGNQIFVEWTMMMAGRMSQSLHVPEIIVVDGFRSAEEAEFFLSQKNTYLVAIVASENEEEDRQIRFERQKIRQRGEEDSSNMREFLKDDKIENNWIQPVIDLARQRGIVIVNNGSLEDLSTKIMAALKDNLPKRND